MLKLKVISRYLTEIIFGRRVNGIKPKHTYRTYGKHQLSEQEWYRTYNVSMLCGRKITYID